MKETPEHLVSNCIESGPQFFIQKRAPYSGIVFGYWRDEGRAEPDRVTPITVAI